MSRRPLDHLADNVNSGDGPARSQDLEADHISPPTRELRGQCSSVNIVRLAQTPLFTASTCAAACASVQKTADTGLVRFTRTATRDTLGTASLSNSTCLPTISGLIMNVSPVTLPPGRARLATSPSRTGSKTYAM